MPVMAKITDHFDLKKTSESAERKPSAKAKQEAEQEVFASTSTANEENDLEILKQFDLNWKFGPTIGLTRLERWERAEKFELNPPKRVKELLTLHQNNDAYAQCLWNEYETLK